MSKKKQVVKLTNVREVKANLPLGGIGIAGNISAEMARGSTLDVSMVRGRTQAVVGAHRNHC